MSAAGSAAPATSQKPVAFLRVRVRRPLRPKAVSPAARVVKNVQPARGKRLRIASCSCFYETRHYIEEIAHAAEKFEVVKDGRAADIFLVGARRGCPTEGTLLHVVERDGVPLLAVIRRERSNADRARL